MNFCDIPHIDFCSDVDFSYIPAPSFENNFFATFFVAGLFYLDHLSNKGKAYIYYMVLTVSATGRISNLALLLAVAILVGFDCAPEEF